MINPMTLTLTRPSLGEGVGGCELSKKCLVSFFALIFLKAVKILN